MDDAIYCQSIVEACNIIKPLLVNKIKEIDNEDLLYKIEQPLSLILAEIEINGVLIDSKLLKELDKGSEEGE